MPLKYRRVLLKISGEFFSGEHGGIDFKHVDELAREVAALVKIGVQLIIVLGAGNLCRGRELAQANVEPVLADHMGMLATIMNALALKDRLSALACVSAVRSALPVGHIVQAFNRDEALDVLTSDSVLICAGGTGNPFVTTDTAAALRAIELKAEIVLKATKVDGVYSEDPLKNPGAQLFSTLTFDEVIQKQLHVMDLSAFDLMRAHKLPVRVFNMSRPNVFQRIICGEDEGTLVY
jgi:uridylate kinase